MASACWRDYAALTKPRIIPLLLLTTAAAMFAAAGGAPPLPLLLATLLGGALAAGGAGAFNHVLDRDIDRLMGPRTAARPVAAGRIRPARAVEFGLLLTAASFVLLAGVANVLAAALALMGTVLYVGLYTAYLKRRTVHNIVIGGAAGAMPPLVGWAALDGRVAPAAFALFSIVVLWTPPHFWALALLLEPGYARAGVPMLPVVRGRRETTRQILKYSLGLVAFTLLPVVWHQAGLVYLMAACLLGGWFLALAWRLHGNPAPQRATAFFHASLLYLSLLFTAVAVDAVVR